MSPSDYVKKAGRVALGPVTARLDFVRRDLDVLTAAQGNFAAQLEQLTAAQRTIHAYIDRVREEATAQVNSTAAPAIALGRAIGADAGIDDTELVARLDALGALDTRLEDLAARTQARDEANEDDIRALNQRLGELRRDLHAARNDIAEIRSLFRITQAMVEQLPTTGPVTAPLPTDLDASAEAATPVTTTPRLSEPAFAHLVPSFDALYRSFEDHNRGSIEEIRKRFDTDYSALLDTLPDGDEPVVDLGCGRGELVEFLTDRGIAGIGVDSNLGQLVDGGSDTFVQADLFRWLDEQPDASVRAVFSLHVIEHVPIDLKIRLVFEARRVLVPGGVLVLETPNALSLSTAATNFWADPTHLEPVHPALVEMLLTEAGFVDQELLPLHPIPLEFSGTDEAPTLRDDLQSLILGHGDMAFIARR